MTEATSIAPAPPVRPPPSSADALIDFLRDRDAPCPLCQYNLRGLVMPRCPECGHELELRVGLTESRQGAWLTALIATALPAGVGLLLIVSILKDGWPGNSGRMVFLRNLCFSYYLVAIALAATVFWLRRRYLRLDPLNQWMIAVAACVVGGLCIASLALTD